MIRHHAFFETLGALEASDAAWSPILAGLSVLRIVDLLSANAGAAVPDEVLRATIDAALATAASISDGDPSRAILLRTLDVVRRQQAISADLASNLMAYARSLDLEARWALAADVFLTVSENFRARQFNTQVIESLTALGAAACNTGDWKTSDRAYAEAQHLADSVGDRVLSLTAQVGIANSHVAHGNLPAAEAELAEVLVDARTLGLQKVEAIALHAQAYLAITSADYQRAVHCGYRSLELTTSVTARDRVLGDLAAAYAGLGFRKTARDGYSIVAVTSPHQWVRWQATLNLMELAVEDGEEISFDEYSAQLENESLDPRLRSYFLLSKARGFRRFGRAGSDELLASAHHEAAKNGLHQIAFDADAERINQRVPVPVREPAENSLDVESGEIERIAEVLAHLREEATAK